MAWVNALIQGILLGGLYALFATGQALVFGVMRLDQPRSRRLHHPPGVHLAGHGDALGFNPFYSIPITMVIMFVVGYALQRGVLNRIVGSKIAIGVIVTFGISMVIQNGLLVAFTPDSQGLDAGHDREHEHPHQARTWPVGWLPLIIFIMAVVVIAALQLFLDHTKLGRAFRAISDDQEAARLVGINNRHIYAIAMGVALAIIVIGGVMMGIRTTFDPLLGSQRLIFAFEAVIIGGHGLGLGDADRWRRPGACPDPGRRKLLGSSWAIFAGHAVFVLILVLRPQGLLAKTVLVKQGGSQ